MLFAPQAPHSASSANKETTVFGKVTIAGLCLPTLKNISPHLLFDVLDPYLSGIGGRSQNQKNILTDPQV